MMELVLNDDSDAILFEAYNKTKVFSASGKLISSDTNLRNKIAERHYRLVTYVITTFYGDRVNTRNKQHNSDIRSDVMQEGFMALLDAVEGYNTSLGWKFSTYAVHWVKQTINRYLSEDKKNVYVPSHVRSLQNKIAKRARDKEVEPKVYLLREKENIKKEFEVTDRMIDNVMSAMHSCTGMISVPLEEIKKTETTVHEGDKTLDERKLAAVVKEVLFETLEEKHRLVILYRYGQHHHA